MAVRRERKGVMLAQPLIGTITNGHSIGERLNIKFILRECFICKEQKWVRLSGTKELSYTGLCFSCIRAESFGEDTSNWKGGRYTDGSGYIRVNCPDHPFADSLGYVLEHRLIMANLHGVDALKGMIVHHIDGDRQNNNPENLEILTRPEHSQKHRSPNSKNQRLGESNPIIECACGCGAEFPKYSYVGRPRKYIKSHNSHGKFWL